MLYSQEPVWLFGGLFGSPTPQLNVLPSAKSVVAGVIMPPLELEIVSPGIHPPLFGNTP